MILPSLANKGPVVVAKDLCEKYVQMGHVCKVFYFNEILELKMPCAVERINFRHKIDFSEWDIVHSHCFLPDLYIWYHYRNISKHNCKCVTTLHNPISYKAARTAFGVFKSMIISSGWRCVLPKFDKVVVLNNELAAQVKIADSTKLQVITNGRDIASDITETDTSNIDKIKELKKQYAIIGSVSIIDSRKNVIQLIRCLSRLPNFAYVAVGDGPQLNDIKVLSKELKVYDRCLFIGYSSNPLQYYKYFDVFAMCSKSEGFPLAFIEAASFGIPTILSDIPILKSIATDKEVCFYHLNDDESFVENVNKVMANAPLYREAVRSFYLSDLTAAKMTQKYIDLYRSII